MTDPPLPIIKVPTRFYCIPALPYIVHTTRFRVTNPPPPKIKLPTRFFCIPALPCILHTARPRRDRPTPSKNQSTYPILLHSSPALHIPHCSSPDRRNTSKMLARPQMAPSLSLGMHTLAKRLISGCGWQHISVSLLSGRQLDSSWQKVPERQRTPIGIVAIHHCDCIVVTIYQCLRKNPEILENGPRSRSSGRWRRTRYLCPKGHFFNVLLVKRFQDFRRKERGRVSSAPPI